MDNWGRDALPGELYRWLQDWDSVTVAVRDSAVILYATADGETVELDLPRGVALELAGALARAVATLPAVDENGRRLQMGPDGRAWDVPLDWPADRCATCWGADGSHALWCPASSAARRR